MQTVQPTHHSRPDKAIVYRSPQKRAGSVTTVHLPGNLKEQVLIKLVEDKSEESLSGLAARLLKEYVEGKPATHEEAKIPERLEKLIVMFYNSMKDLKTDMKGLREDQAADMASFRRAVHAGMSAS
jgi:hypothetical protein